MAKNAMRYLNGFTEQRFNKFDMYMRDRLVRVLHFPDTIRKPLVTKDKCSRCGVVGHRKTNRSICPLYEGGGSSLVVGGGEEENEVV